MYVVFRSRNGTEMSRDENAVTGMSMEEADVFREQIFRGEFTQKNCAFTGNNQTQPQLDKLAKCFSFSNPRSIKTQVISFTLLRP